jgi:hypothetical protein
MGARIKFLILLAIIVAIASGTASSTRWWVTEGIPNRARAVEFPSCLAKAMARSA